jgi:hypothetical protein
VSEAPAPQSRAVLQDNGVALTLHAYSASDGPPTVVALTADAAEDLGIELIRGAMRQRRRERNHIAGVEREI